MSEEDGMPLVSAGPTLPERIRALRDEADAFLDESARRLSETTPNVPLHVLRNLLMNRTHGCQCRAVLNNSESAA
jgi:hypothetical protein